MNQVSWFVGYTKVITTQFRVQSHAKILLFLGTVVDEDFNAPQPWLSSLLSLINNSFFHIYCVEVNI